MRSQDAAGLIPTAFADDIAGREPDTGPSGSQWLARLPALIAEVANDWELALSAPSAWGVCSVVVPAETSQGPAAAKFAWPHREGADEHLALRAWDGRGAVRLLRADPARSVLLLERLSTQDLESEWDEEACRIIGGLYRDLHVPALPQLRRLSSWARGESERMGASDMPRRVTSRVQHLVQRLTEDADCDATLLHGDLHYGNVLSDGTDWVAIDPKPMAGHPGFEVAPLLYNRVEEMGSGPSLRYSVRRRLEVVCEAGGVDAERAREWSIVRIAINALWASRSADRTAVSSSMALLKALDD